MEFKWESRSIGELFTLINGHAFKSSDFRNEGVPVLKIKNIKAGKINHEKLECVDQSYLEKYNEKITCYNDLLITMTGNRHDGNPETWVGKVAWWGNDSQYLINQRVGILRLNRDIQANARFLAYQLTSWPLQKHFISIATSSGGQANISPQQIYSVEITLPPLHVQNKIASFIGALEDKMQINYQTIFNLEQLSQTLFKRWFIDFEFPNEEGQPYKSSGGEMVESELGLIPKGWSIYKLNDFAQSISKSINKKEVVKAKFLNTSDVLKGHVSDVGFTSTKEMPGQAKKLIEKNDILYSEIRPKNKRYAYVQFKRPEDYVVSESIKYFV